MRFRVFLTTLSFLAISIYSSSVYGQNAEPNQTDLACMAKTEANLKKSTQPIDDLINSGKMTDSTLIGDLYFFNSWFIHSEIHKFSTKSTQDSEILKNLYTYLEIMENASNFSKCIDEIKIRHNRLKALNGFQSYYAIRKDSLANKIKQEDFDYLKPLGYKKDRDGIGLGLSISQGNDTWLGVSFSKANLLNMNSKYETTCEGKKQVLNTNLFSRHNFEGFNFNYSRNLNSKLNDISFDLIRINSPLALSLIQFGYFFGENLTENSFYYRPRLGVGFGPISLSYSYSIIFNKNVRPQINDKGLFTLRVNYPITNTRGK